MRLSVAYVQLAHYRGGALSVGSGLAGIRFVENSSAHCRLNGLLGPLKPNMPTPLLWCVV